jgi:hypothetical protein
VQTENLPIPRMARRAIFRCLTGANEAPHSRGGTTLIPTREINFLTNQPHSSPRYALLFSGEIPHPSIAMFGESW